MLVGFARRKIIDSEVRAFPRARQPVFRPLARVNIRLAFVGVQRKPFEPVWLQGVERLGILAPCGLVVLQCNGENKVVVTHPFMVMNGSCAYESRHCNFIKW